VFLKTKWSTDELPIEVLETPPFVTIPLIQHTGTPALPLVRVGDHVAAGCIIGDSPDESSCAVHASISGVVTAILRYPYVARGAFSVTIENDGSNEFASPIPYDKSWQDSSSDELIEKIKIAGIVDGDGAGTPLKAKLTNSRTVPVILLNALETEPWCSAGSRLIIEQAEQVLLGVSICKHITGASSCIIVADEKRTRVLAALNEALKNESFAGISIKKMKKPRYPVQEDRSLPQACGYDEDGSMVIGTAAAYAVADAIVGLQPSFRRVMTVAGPMVETPKNLVVPVGTPVRFLLDACGVDMGRISKLVFGGPLSGQAVQNLAMPVTRNVSAILPLAETGSATHDPCISCRRCHAVCPAGLEPARLAQLAGEEDAAGLNDWFVQECIECGCCAWVCPAHINLVHHIAFGKILGNGTKKTEVVS